MSLGGIALAWAAVAAWLFLWMLVERRVVRSSARHRRRDDGWIAGEALLLTLLAALWYGSLGAGMGWLVFFLIGALMEWPVRSTLAAARVARVLAAGALLGRLLGP